jgi:hypothetical protein
MTNGLINRWLIFEKCAIFVRLSSIFESGPVLLDTQNHSLLLGRSFKSIRRQAKETGLDKVSVSNGNFFCTLLYIFLFICTEQWWKLWCRITIADIYWRFIDISDSRNMSIVRIQAQDLGAWSCIIKTIDTFICRDWRICSVRQN